MCVPPPETIQSRFLPKGGRLEDNRIASGEEDKLAARRLNKQVTGELGISEITVKQHRGQVMQKWRTTR
jgi:hypothetical protein